MAFQKATKRQAKLRMGLHGPSGSGKTYSALAIATEFIKALGVEGRIAVIDSERGSASKYADRFDFDVCELSNFAPRAYRQAISDAVKGGYAVLIIDSISHAWVGEGGVLDIVDNAATKLRGNTHAAWKEGTPEYRDLVDAILQAPTHIIATMRSKTEWDMSAVNEQGKKTPKKIGSAPVMRDGIEYEFDVTGMLDVDHNLVIDKTRCDILDGKVFKKPGKEPAETLAKWLSDGAPPPVNWVDVATAKMREHGAAKKEDFQAMIAFVSKNSVTPDSLKESQETAKMFCTTLDFFVKENPGKSIKELMGASAS
jgi:hypothetical protein